MSQTGTHSLEGRKREEWVGELGNVAHHKRVLTSWRGGRGGSRLVNFGNLARHKRGLTRWRGGRGRSGLVSFETWHVTNKDSLPGGRKREEQVGEVGNQARNKQGLTPW